MFIIKKYYFLLIFLLFLVLITPLTTQAYRIENLSGVEVSGDFVVMPAKTELILEPGSQETKDIVILNRSGVTLNLKIEIEDFSASLEDSDSRDLIKFWGKEKGPYSLKDYIRPEVYNISINHGEQLTLPVLISIPNDSKPGGLYAGVVISGQASLAEQAVNQNIKTVSRLVSLFFVKVDGELNEQGKLIEFKADKNFYWSGPINFSLVFANESNTHLNPYGELTINNIWGKRVYQESILPYFVMPFSQRWEQKNWEEKNLLGIYKATLKMNRGYDNFIDVKTVYFIACPFVLMIFLIIVIILFLLIIYRYKKYFRNK